MRLLPRLACLLAGLAACAVAAAQPAPLPVAPPPRLKRVSDAEVARLIARVGSPSFAEREAATEELKRRPEAQAAVEKALAAATNPEVARRLGAVSAVLKREWARKRLAKLPEYVQHRQFDRLVETMVLCREYLTDEHDKHIRAFVEGVYEDASGVRPRKLPSGEQFPRFETFAWKYRLGGPEVFDGKRSLIAQTVTEPVRDTAICASDWVGPPRPVTRGWATLGGSVIFCNGDVDVFCVDNCIVIATGDVRIHSSAGGSLVIGAGDVLASFCDCSVVVSRGRFDRVQDDRRSVVRAGDVDFFRGWRLLSRADTGAELVSVFGLVWVAAVTPGSPFDRAGVRGGDFVTRVDDTPVWSVQEAHRLLCRAAVGRGEADLKLVRHGRAIRVVAALETWE
jgi:hypothetical protein